MTPTSALPITEFRNKYAFLSNFYKVPLIMTGEVYPTLEHAFQAAKSWKNKERDVIRLAETASDAKRFGKQVTLRLDWEEVKLEIMEDLLRQKFSSNNMKKRLLDTGDAELIEGNWFKDFYWGVCDGKGENHLGKLLMKIREEMRAGIPNNQQG